MLIDPYTGLLDISRNIAISNNLTKSSIEPFIANNAIQMVTQHQQYSSYKIVGEYKSKQVHTLIYFTGDLITFVSLAISPDDKVSTWDDWSLEYENERKRFHDGLLAEELGPPHLIQKYILDSSFGASLDALHAGTLEYTFGWGKVSSCYAAQSGDSSIVIRYS